MRHVRRSILGSALLFIVSSALAVSGAGAAEREVTLFDKQGQAIAYIAADDEATIYLWEGRPVAYLKRRGDDLHVYNFDGEHLGWLDRGIPINHEGDGVGFIEGAVSVLTELEPLKGLKELKPLRGLEELAPLRPLRSGYWSPIPLSVFLST